MPDVDKLYIDKVPNNWSSFKNRVGKLDVDKLLSKLSNLVKTKLLKILNMINKS